MGHSLNGAAKALQADRSYLDEFQKAWGTDQITIDLVAKSIAVFERTVLSGNSPFDRYYYGGDKKALSPSAARGLKVFMDASKGNCAACHTIDKKYALFTDGKFHNIGVGVDLNGNFGDRGRSVVSKNEADTGAFKTPTLRNIAQTAPYMHDGSLKTLKEVIDHYIGGGNSNPHLDKQIKVLDFLTGQERADLEEFLISLTGELPPNVGPPSVSPKNTAQMTKK
jgi:cytochrome c peroxidase